MANKFNPSQFQLVAQFGNVEEIMNPNTGNTTESFNAHATIHYYERKRTLDQAYQLLGTELANTILMVVQHNKELEQYLTVQIDNELYDVIDYSPDNVTVPFALDYVTVRKQTKGA